MESVFVFFKGLLLLHIIVIAGTNFNECIDSGTTVRFVTICPKTVKEWEEAAAKKRCEMMKNSCSSFVYHCVMNAWKNQTVEVCAPRVNIVGNVCAEYNFGGSRIQRSGKIFCNECPSMYESTDSYKYQECYDTIKEENVLLDPKQSINPTNIIETKNWKDVNISRFNFGFQEKRLNRSQHENTKIGDKETVLIASVVSVFGVLTCILLTMTRHMWINLICTQLKKFILKDGHFPQIPEDRNLIE